MANNNLSKYWDIKHSYYSKEDWINKPSLFSQTAIKYFPKKGLVLDLGAGQGQDSRYFAENGFNVISTDFSENILKINKDKTPQNLKYKIKWKIIDLNKKIPFADKSFDVVYSHLALHYFSKQKTLEIFKEIKRVLKKEGVLAFLVNSTDDIEFNTGKKIEDYYFQIRGLNKRFFNLENIQEFIKGFEIKLLDNLGETYKDRKIGIKNLIRFIGKKL